MFYHCIAGVIKYFDSRQSHERKEIDTDRTTEVASVLECGAPAQIVNMQNKSEEYYTRRPNVDIEARNG